MILYVETNFPISIATGRDPDATKLLSPPQPLRIVIPSACCLEAFSVLEDERKGNNRFNSELEAKISQVQRDTTSAHARQLLAHLRQSRIENKALLDDIQGRLFQTLDQLINLAEWTGLPASVLAESLKTKLVKDPTDNLILHAILDHARSQPPGPKALLTGNFSDFDTADVRLALHRAGVEKYFRTAQKFLEWFHSQASSGP